MLDHRYYVRSSKRFRKYFIDQYAWKAQIQGLRSRAWFKIQEIDRLDSLFYSGMTVIDLGSAPGGWSFYASKKVGNFGKIIACDLLPMNSISGVNFLQGDCTDPNIFKVLSVWIQNQKVQLILSDMSPNTTGISIIDVNKSVNLAKIALDICHRFLVSKGKFLVKIFQGKGFEKYLCDVQSMFNTVKIRKPSSSRFNSREVYIVAKNLR